MGSTMRSIRSKKMLASKFTFEAIGTFFEIATQAPLPEELQQRVVKMVDEFDKEFSRFREDSIVTKAASLAGKYSFSSHAQKLFAFYETLYRQTDGKVTPLVGASLESLGYDANYSLRFQATTPALNYSELIKRSSSTLEVKEPTLLDFGAAGKGYLVDSIAELLESEGISQYLIDASGDMIHKAGEAEVIGLEDPLNEGSVIGEVTLKNKALCASATNRRKWGDGLHHVVDPDTGAPTESIVATWVIADSTMIADGLATALFFVEPNLLKESYTYEYMRVYANGSADFSEGFAETLY